MGVVWDWGSLWWPLSSLTCRLLLELQYPFPFYRGEREGVGGRRCFASLIFFWTSSLTLVRWDSEGVGIEEGWKVGVLAKGSRGWGR